MASGDSRSGFAGRGRGVSSTTGPHLPLGVSPRKSEAGVSSGSVRLRWRRHCPVMRGDVWLESSL